MRRADRLFLIIHALRGRRTALPARRLADSLQVSLRTVYRDVADLQRSGVAIEGEAGIGYVLRKGTEVPPLMFSVEELEALVVGTRFTGAFGGKRLALAARAALLKIEAVLPEPLRQRTRRTRIYAPELADRIEATDVLDRLRASIEAHRVLRVAYRDKEAQPTARDIEPLCLSFWGDTRRRPPQLPRRSPRLVHRDRRDLPRTPRPRSRGVPAHPRHRRGLADHRSNPSRPLRPARCRARAASPGAAPRRGAPRWRSRQRRRGTRRGCRSCRPCGAASARP
jgi:biotin operon repressor